MAYLRAPQHIKYNGIEEVQHDDEEWVQIGWVNEEETVINSCADITDIESLNESNDINDNTPIEAIQDNVNSETSQSEINNDEMRYSERDSEESDDVSVITDSEVELNGSKRFNGICLFGNKMCGRLKMYESSKVRTRPSQIKISINFIIGCVLGFLLGFIAKHAFTVTDKCSIGYGIDLEGIRMESKNLINNFKELNEVKTILDEIKASNPEVNKYSMKEMKKIIKSIYNTEGPIRMSSTDYSNHSFTALHQLQNSLNSLSLIVNEIDVTNESFKFKMNKTQSILADLSKFQKVLLNFTKEISILENPVEIRILQNIIERIINASQSVLYNLAETIKKLTVNINNKFEKIKYKLNKSLCRLKKVLPNSQMFFRELDSFLTNCGETCNTKYNRNEKSNQKVVTKEKDIKKSRKRKQMEEITLLKSNFIQPSAEEGEDWKYDLKKLLSYETEEHNNMLFLEQKVKTENSKEFLNGSVTTKSVLSQALYATSQSPEFCTAINSDERDCKVSTTDAHLYLDSTNHCNLLPKKEENNGVKDLHQQIQRHTDKCETKNNILNSNKRQDKNRPASKPPKFDRHNNFIKARNDTFFNVEKKKDRKPRTNPKKQKGESSSSTVKHKHKRKFKSCKCSQQKDTEWSKINSDWQFERSLSREKLRHKSQDRPCYGFSNWYFKRAYSRKNIRENSDFKETPKFYDISDLTCFM